MDYYKVLGINNNASKEEIKESFRKLAMQFHPDKHSGSPDSVKHGATLRFKQASEAYEVLIDDRKRADYNSNLRYNHRGKSDFSSSAGRYGYGYGGYRHNNSYGYNNNNNGYGYSRSGNGDQFASRVEIALRFLTTRAFLLNLAFAGVLLGGSIIIDKSRDEIWKMHNSGILIRNQERTASLNVESCGGVAGQGDAHANFSFSCIQKSFEEAMESLEKGKALKDKR
ncbi:hypothetical protein LguiA_024477 [Lonicera macranthoides]